MNIDIGSILDAPAMAFDDGKVLRVREMLVCAGGCSKHDVVKAIIAEVEVRLAAAQDRGPFVVWRKGGDKPNHQFDTKDVVMREANDMAKAFPGSEILVARVLHRLRAEVKVFDLPVVQRPPVASAPVADNPDA